MTTTNETQGQTLAKRTVCLQLTLGRFGNSRKMGEAEFETKADKDMVRASKKLLDSKTLELISRHDGQTQSQLRALSLSPFLKGGIYMLPTSIISRVEDIIEERLAERERMIDTFVEEFEELVRQAKEKLGPTFHADEYPEVDDVRATFSAEMSYLTFDTPEALKDVRAALFDRERERMKRKWEIAADQSRDLLRAQMSDLVGHMVDRLSADTDGKAKIFKGTLTTNMATFLETLPFRNVLDDAELDKLCSKAKKLLVGVSAEELRKDDGLRANVAKGFTELKAELDKLVVERPVRAVQIEREEPAA